jgi:geranylgeranyl pyrophosphate synthase
MSYDNVLGKRVGTDLKEGKITLPLIHALKQAGEWERSSISRVVNKSSMTKRDFERVRNIIQKYGGIDYTEGITKKYIDDARTYLNIFKPSPYKDALLKPVHASTRNRQSTSPFGITTMPSSET